MNDYAGQNAMDLTDDISQLRQHVDDLAGSNTKDLDRYYLRWPPMPPGLYWRLRWLVGWLLRCLESMHLKKPDGWPAVLKHRPGSTLTKPLLIWAIGTDRDVLRAACRGFSSLQQSLPGMEPVLVTDVADFAFFSRLGWLVEYVPELTGAGESYAARKAGFIVRLYCSAPVLPAYVGLLDSARTDEVRRLVLRDT